MTFLEEPGTNQCYGCRPSQWSEGVRSFPCSSNLNFACERERRFPQPRPPWPQVMEDEVLRAAVLVALSDSFEKEPRRRQGSTQNEPAPALQPDKQQSFQGFQGFAERGCQGFTQRECKDILQSSFTGFMQRDFQGFRPRGFEVLSPRRRMSANPFLRSDLFLRRDQARMRRLRTLLNNLLY